MLTRRSRHLTLALAVALTAVVPATASEPRFQGSFTATGVPWANFSYQVPSDRGCGQEGVHHTTFVYTVPAGGTLAVNMDGFQGDWELELYDSSTGEWLSGSYGAQVFGAEAVEHMQARVRKGQRVEIVACNWLSPQREVQVRYELTGGDGFARGGRRTALANLSAGGLPVLRERVPVNFVFLGYKPRQVNASSFLRALPRTYRPLVRARAWYGGREYLGIEYSYDYNAVFTDRAYEDRFFGMLRRIGRPSPPTYWQTQYNDQQKNVLDVTGNLNVSAQNVERWLGANPPPGVDTLRDTVFFVNWYGRRDFRFHVYRKTGEPNSDTGIDFGTRSWAAMIGWGGTPPADEEDPADRPYRVWFYDLSAGPEYWTQNYVVDSQDADGDGKPDYRMPPVWEYRNGGFRSPSALTGDLAKIARYVAINLLFTASPLYPPALAPPAIPETVALDLNWYEGRPDADTAINVNVQDGTVYDTVSLQRPEAYAKATEIRDKVQELLPFSKVEVDEQVLPLWEDQELSRCWSAFFGSYSYGPSCYAERPYVNWQSLYLHHALSPDDTLDDRGRVDYEVGLHSYFVPDDNLAFGFAYADDNQRDGTQSMVHWFPLPSQLRTIGSTDVLIHELGHHFGMSHTHDGYDSEEGLDYSGYSGRLAFAASGDEVNSTMSYLNWLSNEFSQFDLDNHNRWMTAAYLANASKILDSILRDPDAGRVQGILRDADGQAGRARALFSAHGYLDAHRAARQAYLLVRRAASAAGVRVTGSSAGLRVDSAAGATGSSTSGALRSYASLDRFRSVVDGVPLMRPGPPGSDTE